MWYYVIHVIIDVVILGIIVYFVYTKNNRIYDTLVGLNSQIAQLNLRLCEIDNQPLHETEQTTTVTKLEFVPEGSVKIVDIGENNIEELSTETNGELVL